MTRLTLVEEDAERTCSPFLDLTVGLHRYQIREAEEELEIHHPEVAAQIHFRLVEAVVVRTHRHEELAAAVHGIDCCSGVEAGVESPCFCFG